MLRIGRERLLELGDRLVGLVGVEIRHAEIRAQVRIRRRELERGFVPGNRQVETFRVEVEVAELGARGRVLGIAVRDLGEFRHFLLVDWRDRRRRGLLRAHRLRAGGRRRRRGGGDRGGRRQTAALLAAENPSGQYAEEHAGDQKDEVVAFHTVPIIAAPGPARPSTRGRRFRAPRRGRGSPAHVRSTLHREMAGCERGRDCRGPDRARH